MAGCAVGPDYKRPVVDAPANYRFAANQSANSMGDLPWWEVFKDPVLLELITTAVTNNYDLRQALARVEQARNVAVAARAPLFPQIGYGGTVGRGRNAAFNSPAPMNGAVESFASATLSAFWEIDLWGRTRRLSEAARAEYLATDEARRAITTALVSDVATAYFQLLQFDEELVIQRAATNAYASSLRLFEDRLRNGVASKLETDRAAAALANAASIIPRLELSIATTENQLNILLGHNPQPIARNSLTNQILIAPDIPAGLPSDLLRRRPDILEREQLLIAANASVGANLANFFPQIGLTTFIGKVSPELSAFTAGTANMWNVGASLAGPIFQGGQLRAQYRGSKARFDEARASYQQSILTAYRKCRMPSLRAKSSGKRECITSRQRWRWLHRSTLRLSATLGVGQATTKSCKRSRSFIHATRANPGAGRGISRHCPALQGARRWVATWNSNGTGEAMSLTK
jgi:multidrug efflux system outer membrane protein